MSLAQNHPPGNVALLIRTSSDNPLAMAGALRAAVRRVETNAPIIGVAPLEQQLGTYLTQRRFQTSLLTGFSVVALLMAAVGIYGLIQYSIATRTPEIGLRIAVGAQAGDIFRMIIGEGLTLSLAGVAIGLVGAWWLGTRGLESAVWRDRQRSVDVRDGLAPADGGRHFRLLFPGATRNESGPATGTACDVTTP